jgi:hypothetical protein
MSIDNKKEQNEQCTIPVVRRSISLWKEGFAATGQRQGASMIEGDVDWDRFGRGRHAIWACEIFDNEAEARKSFG